MENILDKVKKEIKEKKHKKEKKKNQKHVKGKAQTTDEPYQHHSYKVGKKIGAGNFGKLHMCTKVDTGKIVAIKFESRDNERHIQLLDTERRCYKRLQRYKKFCKKYYDRKRYIEEHKKDKTLNEMNNDYLNLIHPEDPTDCPECITLDNSGIPYFYLYGTFKNHNALVIELLGPSLEDLFELCRRQFSVKTVAMIGIQIIKIMKNVHSEGIIFRDVKPENFLVGRKSKVDQIYIIDFGLAKDYINKSTNEHIPYCENKNLTGTARYMSINTHKGCEQSRRDDMESIGHLLIYFLKGGKLPWQGLPATNSRDRYRKIAKVKEHTPIHELCKSLPKQFAEYLRQCRNLEFYDNPDYDGYIKLFEHVLREQKKTNDRNFDWLPEVNSLLAKSKHKINENKNLNNNYASTEYNIGKCDSYNINANDEKNWGHINIQPIVNIETLYKTKKYDAGDIKLKGRIEENTSKQRSDFCKFLREKLKSRFVFTSKEQPSSDSNLVANNNNNNNNNTHCKTKEVKPETNVASDNQTGQKMKFFGIETSCSNAHKFFDNYCFTDNSVPNTYAANF